MSVLSGGADREELLIINQCERKSQVFRSLCVLPGKTGKEECGLYRTAE